MGAGCAATIALVAGGYLVMTTPDPAAGESNSEGLKGGWLAQLLPRSKPAEDEDVPELLRPGSQKNSQKKKAADPPATKRKEKSKEDLIRPGQQKKKATDKTPDPAARNHGNVGGEGDLFRPGPQYDKKYDSKGNVDIYGAKKAVEPPRPALELGRQQYTSGSYPESGTLLGELNPLLPGLSVYGDWRTAVAYNSNAGKDIAQIATRLNLDVDFKFTSTERIHAFFTPLQKNNKFTRYEFGGGDGDRKFHG